MFNDNFNLLTSAQDQGLETVIADTIIQFTPRAQKGGYSAHFERKQWRVETNDFITAQIAINRQHMAKLSGHIREYSGYQSPKFEIRALWPKTSSQVLLNKNTPLGIPSFFLKESTIHLFCERTIELGYNSIVIGSWFNQAVNNNSEIKNESIDITSALMLIKKYQLKLYFALSEDVDHVEDLFLNSCDGLIVNINCIATADCTMQELVIQKLCCLEKRLPKGKKIIAYVNGISPLELTEDCSTQTLLAFPATASDPFNTPENANVLWQDLRLKKRLSDTPILPIFNTCGVGFGEGLWPLLPSCFWQKYIMSMDSSPFIGGICLMNGMPKKGSLLDANLWLMQEMLWSQKPADLLFETWVKVHHPDWPKQIIQLLNEVGDIAKWFHKRSKSNETKSKTEPDIISYRLIELEQSISNLEEELKAYFTFFIIDARRILMHLSKRDHFPLTKLGTEEIIQSAFWTVNGKGGVLEQPSSGPKGSLQEKIYGQNRWI